MSKSDFELEFGVESDDRCPKAEDGKHKPNIHTLTLTVDGGQAYVDVTCSICGRSGCVCKFDPDEVTW